MDGMESPLIHGLVVGIAEGNPVTGTAIGLYHFFNGNEAEAKRIFLTIGGHVAVGLSARVSDVCGMGCATALVACTLECSMMNW